MNHLIELGRAQATQATRDKVGRSTSIGAGLAAAGTLGMGLYNMKKGKKFGAFKPKVSKKLRKQPGFNTKPLVGFGSLGEIEFGVGMKRLKDIRNQASHVVLKHPKKILAGGAAAALGAGYLKNERHDKRMKTDPAYRKADKRKRAGWARDSEAHDREVAKLRSTTHGKGTFFSPHKKGAIKDIPYGLRGQTFIIRQGGNDRAGDWYDESDIRAARKRAKLQDVPDPNFSGKDYPRPWRR